MRESANLLPQVRAIDGLDLRDIHHRWFRNVTFPSPQPDITRKCGIAQVGCNGYHYHCIEAAAVKPIVLQDEGWPATPWFRAP